MFKKIKQWFKNHIDYRIIRTDLVKCNDGTYRTKHIKRYYIKKLKRRK